MKTILHVTVENLIVVQVHLFFDALVTPGYVMVTEIVQMVLMRLHVVCIMILSFVTTCTFNETVPNYKSYDILWS